VMGRDPLQLELLRMSIRDTAAYGMLEVACLDIIGRALGQPVVNLIGGRYRSRAEFAACISFLLPDGDHPGVATPEALAEQFLIFHRQFGFFTCHLTGGVLPPDRELEALRLIRAAVPQARLRIAPGEAWSLETALRFVEAAKELAMEYVEDPTQGLDGLGEVRRHTRIPVGSSLGITGFADLPVAFRKESADVIVADLHSWGGLFNCRKLAGVCETFGWGLGGRSSPHLGVSMAAMAHLYSALPAVVFAAGTHYPWTTEDVVKERLVIESGTMRPSDGPGLGVEIDPGRMERLAANMERLASRSEALKRWNPKYPQNRRMIRF
jgi:glucarate dehydratase